MSQFTGEVREGSRSKTGFSELNRVRRFVERHGSGGPINFRAPVELTQTGRTSVMAPRRPLAPTSAV